MKESGTKCASPLLSFLFSPSTQTHSTLLKLSPMTLTTCSLRAAPACLDTGSCACVLGRVHRFCTQKSDERIRYEMLPSHHREIETQHNKGEFVRVDTATHQANKKEKAEGEQPRTFPKTWRRATGTLPVGMPLLAVPYTA